ncbi:MAG: ABC transporter substrate-binding protein [Chloroflexi bacterium]|nr:ABC transporter substrate-binding protein [Chloroflexota bacterium]
MSRLMWKLIPLAVVASLMAACTAVAPSATPAKPAASTVAPTVAATTAPKAEAATPKPAAPTPTPAPKIKRGGTLRVAEEEHIPHLDPYLSASAHRGVYGLVYNSLVRRNLSDPNTGKFEVQPALAESWQVVDPTTVVFKLRKGVKFHDGSDFDAEVAKWNLDRMAKNPQSVAKDVVESIEQVEVVDKDTIKLHLKAPSASLLVMLTPGGSAGRSRIVSKAAVEKLGDQEFGRAGIGSGPMRVTKWVPDDRVLMERFDGYWEKGEDGKPLPYIDAVVDRFIPDPTTILAELRVGTIDLTDRIDVKDVTTVKSASNLVYWEIPWGGVGTYLGINAQQGPFASNLKLRQAAAHAMNRDAMVKTLLYGIGGPLYWPWAKGDLGYDESSPYYKTDPARAKQLVSEAGYPSGIDARLMIYGPPIRLRNAEMMKQMLDDVGIRTTIDNFERLAWINKARTREGWDLLLVAFDIFPDPDGHSRNLTTTGLGNWTGQQNPEMDKCMAAGRSSYDPKQRHEAYKRCSDVIYNDAYFTTLWLLPHNFVFQKNVKGVTMEYYRMWDAKYVWLDN